MLLLHRYGQTCIVEANYRALPGPQAQAALRTALAYLFAFMARPH